MKYFTYIILILIVIIPSTSVASELPHFQTSTLKEPPKRIVSLKPNITELLFEIGAGDQVVGVSTWCNKPDAAKKLPKVADYIKPNIEMIMVLKPDLVVTSRENSIKAPIDILEKMGIPVLVLPFQSIDDFLASTKILGETIGHSKEATDLIHRITALKEERAGENADRKTLIIVGKRPLIAAGPTTFLGELIRLSGGKNIVESKIPYPHVNMELILAQDPEVIIDLSMGSEDKSSNVQHYWKRYPIEAVKKNRIHDLNISDFRIGPGLIEQVATLKEILGGNND